MYRKRRQRSSQTARDSANGSPVPPPVGERVLVDRYGRRHSERVLTTWSPALLRAMGIVPHAEGDAHNNLTPEFSEHAAVDGGGAVPQAGSEPANDIKSHQGANQMNQRKTRRGPPKTGRTRPASAPAPISTGPTLITKANRPN
jgi:hypothetical protein